MSEKIRSTYDEHMKSLSKVERKEFDYELRKLALSEMVLAAMAKDEISVRRLAKIANVSPSIVQDMKSGKRNDFALSSLFKVLDSLGFTLLLERDGEITPLDISQMLQTYAN